MERSLLRATCAGVVAAALAAAAGADTPQANTWVRLADAPPGKGHGAVLLPMGRGEGALYFGGEGKSQGAYIRAFDPARRAWSDFATARPPARRGIHPYYQTVHDPQARRLYCISTGSVYTFDLTAKTWQAQGEPEALAGMSWHAAAIDPKGRKLVVIGADKRPDNLAWTRTVVLDLDSGKWTRLLPPAEPAVTRRAELVAAGQAVGDLVGRIRLAWYRDPTGRGTQAERTALLARCSAVGKRLRREAFAADLDAVAALLRQAKTLDALRAARALHRKLDERAQRAYPVPPARRNSPLVFDASRRVFVLFGGDHEDYLTNNTWVLDLAAGHWRRMSPKLAPSARAGHVLAYLPTCRRIALYGGYRQSNSPDYGVQAWEVIRPRQLWTYDARLDRWDLVGAWPMRRGETAGPPAAETFYGYSCEYYSPPALAAGADDRLVLAVPPGRRHAGGTWALKLDLAQLDAAGRQKLGTAPDQRQYRTGRFLAAYCEVPDAPKSTGLDALPPNRWVKLPPAPRNVAYGCRQRDWGTSVWDAAGEQILLWGGGHCIRSASSVIHYSPVSGRMVEGYDADEPYGRNGAGGFGSSVLNRPWVGVHGYNSYAYDPPSGLMVTATGFLYDPRRMDWLRDGPMERPFRYVWSATVLEATGHGAVAWARDAKRDRWGLWRFDRKAGWIDLKPTPAPFQPYCDSEGMTYDTKRDRLLMGWGGGYAKKGDGRIWSFDFATRKIERLTPAGAELGRIGNTREMMYVDHADWVAFAEPFVAGTGKAARGFLRIYDCAKNRYVLLDAGQGPRLDVHGQGWCYDAKRKLVYVLTYRGAAWAIRFEPQSARLLTAPPAPNQEGSALTGLREAGRLP